MKRIILAFLLLALVCTDLHALDVAGISLEDRVEVQGQPLHLNGYGIRKKFFIKIYIGSLYTATPISSAAEALEQKGGALIRMNFLYDQVDRQKIVDAFADGIALNSPDLQDSEDVKEFLSWFRDDFVRGDVVDLELGADGSVLARHNGTPLGHLRSPAVAKGILLIYLGENPADRDLKAGMLGKD